MIKRRLAILPSYYKMLFFLSISFINSREIPL
ncbi:hypothetical protein HD_0041 [[Haemophilus] ducreyi 35000HP]|uniref:Uncharacterized protein n=1 Tax=Haemophilus ducreyi (strain 35000HP / ATCC 700724) TaxID=233412 RepID=Q7VPM1_HAEDU|nr:hypothetical protein HD_0041 [[Haemophilus] ducreyi 35000HP]